MACRCEVAEVVSPFNGYAFQNGLLKFPSSWRWMTCKLARFNWWVLARTDESTTKSATRPNCVFFQRCHSCGNIMRIMRFGAIQKHLCDAGYSVVWQKTGVNITIRAKLVPHSTSFFNTVYKNITKSLMMFGRNVCSNSIWHLKTN